jgi:hypothetical protein
MVDVPTQLLSATVLVIRCSFNQISHQKLKLNRLIRQVCITKTPDEPQVWLGSNKAFTYDYVYEPDSLQVRKA